MTIPEQAGKVATSAINAFRAQPALLFLTLVNIAFLVFVYFIGTLVLDAYEKDREQMHERYQQALTALDRCFAAAFGDLERKRHFPSTDEMRGQR